MLKLDNKTVKREVKEYIFIAIAMLAYTLAWNFFLIPHTVTGGGGTGFAAIVMYATQGALSDEMVRFFESLGMATVNGGFPVSATLIVFNGFLLTIAVRTLGWQFCIRTIVGVILVTMWFWIPYPEIYESIFGERFPVFDPFMSVIIAGLISGVSLGVIFTNNGSSGGTDILAKIINKYRPTVTLGRALLLCDAVIICSSAFLPTGNIENVVYGLLYMIIQNITVDLYINGIRQSVQFLIFSTEAERIADAISQQAHRGVTLIDGMGWYSKKPIKIVTVLVRKNESTEIFRIVNSIDKNAFISQSAAIGVYGRGFDAMRQK